MTEFLELWTPARSHALRKEIEARLNLRDCAACALASVLQIPLLLKGVDFAATARECHAWFGEFRPELFSRRSAAAAYRL